MSLPLCTEMKFFIQLTVYVDVLGMFYVIEAMVINLIRRQWPFNSCAMCQLYYSPTQPLCIPNDFISWLRHDMEMFSPLLAQCMGNPPIVDGFPSQECQKSGLWCYSKHIGEQRVERPVIWATTTLMLCHGNDHLMYWCTQQSSFKIC